MAARDGKHLTFLLGNEEYAIAVTDVREIVGLGHARGHRFEATHVFEARRQVLAALADPGATTVIFTVMGLGGRRRRRSQDTGRQHRSRTTARGCGM